MRRCSPRIFLSVEHVALLADVAPPAGLDPDAAEPDDGVGEGLVEGGGAVGQRVHHGARPVVGVEQLVGAQQPAAVLQVPVVLVVQLRRRGLVHEHQVVRPAVGALALQEPRVLGVQRRVRRLPRPVLVQPVRELAAVRQPHAVRRRERDEVRHVEPVRLEDREQLVHGLVRLGQLAGHAAGRGAQPVQPAQLHWEEGSATLHAREGRES
jgi:hypothetical protein